MAPHSRIPIDNEHLNYVITLCDHANKSCPLCTGKTQSLNGYLFSGKGESGVLGACINSADLR